MAEHCITIRFTSIIRYLLGVDEETIRLCFNEKPVFGNVVGRIEEMFPKLAELRGRGFEILYVVNGVTPRSDEVLEDGSEVVVLQPASGGGLY